MEKMVISALLLAGLLISTMAVSTAFACEKTAYFVSDEDGDGIIEVGEKIVWDLAIVLVNDLSSPMTDVIVTDNLAAELAVDMTFGFHQSQGTVSYYTTGNSDKLHLTWDVGTLNPGQQVWMHFFVYTDLNPAGRQEYTSPGTYYLNSGPTMKFYVDGVQDSREL